MESFENKNTQPLKKVSKQVEEIKEKKEATVEEAKNIAGGRRGVDIRYQGRGDE